VLSLILATQDKLVNINGIGESIAKIIKEIINTGKCKLLSELEERYKISGYSLVLSYGLNDKTLKKLFCRGITSFDLLLKFVKQGLQKEPFKRPEIEAIIAFGQEYPVVKEWYLFSYAYCLGEELVTLINNFTQMTSAILNMTWQEKVDYIQIECLNSQYDRVKSFPEGSSRYYCVEERCGKNKYIYRFGLPVDIIFMESIKKMIPETFSVTICICTLYRAMANTVSRKWRCDRRNWAGSILGSQIILIHCVLRIGFLLLTQNNMWKKFII
jgi:hypothetical protein